MNTTQMKAGTEQRSLGFDADSLMLLLIRGQSFECN